MARKKIIAGNCKMNMTPSEAVELVNTLKSLVVTEEADVVFCVPAIDIIPVVEAAKGSNIQVGAENMYFEEKGAYTGEISPNMLTDAGVSPCSNAFSIFLFTVSFVSAKYSLLSECPRTTYLTPASVSRLKLDSRM